ncbi:hypothetical protein KEM55_000807 [Ascosphaera atra]|nr:hypothetical protein KEM55_000807 [Ascosphaera atra]
MSKDSSATYLHMHESRLADLFEDFTKHYTPTDQSHSSTTAAAAAAHNTSLFGPGGGPPGLSTYLPIGYREWENSNVRA